MLLSNKELKAKVNVEQDSKLIQWLNAHRVRWLRDAKKKPITTVGEIEKALAQENDGEVRF